MAAAVLHRLLILHPDGGRILQARREQSWQPPELWLPERHTAEVDQINAAVRERFGLKTTVLRDLEHATTAAGVRRTHALEAHPPLPTLASDLVWEPHEEIEIVPILDCPWTAPGWWPGVENWIEAQVGSAEVVQVRAWESSCVARVHAGGSTGATHWFKALPSSAPREADVTSWLSGRPGAPEVVAVERERPWLLLRAFHGASLDDSRDAAPWALALATWARLQAATLARADELQALGCVERRLADLVPAAASLLADGAALMLGHAEGLTAEQIRDLHRFAPQIGDRCEELEALGLPLALDHGDLWPSNLLVGAGNCIIIDWEDAGINHPFQSLGPFAIMLREWQVALPLEEVARIYLAGLLGAPPTAALRRAFLRALPLGLLEMAVRYWRMPPAVVALHPWMREMVPFFLRHMLALADPR